MNRFIKLFLLTLVTVALLFSSLQLKASYAQDSVKISLWSRVANQPVLDVLSKAYNDSHKNQIEVTLIPNDQFVTKFATAMASGAGPDIISIDLIYVPAFAAAGQMTDITDLAKKLPFYDKLSPSHVRLGIYQGKNYSLPFSAEGSVLLYNKGLFKQAGLDPEKPPTTWDEIYQDAKKITALGKDTYGFYFAGSCAGCNAFTYLPLIWASGGDVLSDDGSKATLTDPAVKAALEFYKKMWDEKLIPEGAKVDNGSEFLNAFRTGKIGMAGSGAFSIGTLKKENPEIDFGLTYLPGQKGGKSSFAGGDSIGIPSGSQHVNEAFDFIQWMLTDDVQLEQFAKSNQLPVRTDLAKNKYFDADPRLTVNAQAMALGRTPYSLKYNDLFNDANGPWLAMIQHAIFDGKVDEAIQTAQDSFTKILSQK
jgi:multiple sugar transport system substrate-binding protein